eukprot:CAMPEP_0119283750 /NCGR_PEP_ID=MMETSP1329-20130426/29099_1 /TAXON_ID=114041 /ORGANISM="Genus nov. species nov., Strain RCC1024" /LENGTH=31 /DNA_ID= /DNA_START= /DNA_END= /DNA_ORIENTATION=
MALKYSKVATEEGAAAPEGGSGGGGSDGPFA